MSIYSGDELYDDDITSGPIDDDDQPNDTCAECGRRLPASEARAGYELCEFCERAAARDEHAEDGDAS